MLRKLAYVTAVAAALALTAVAHGGMAATAVVTMVEATTVVGITAVVTMAAVITAVVTTAAIMVEIITAAAITAAIIMMDTTARTGAAMCIWRTLGRPQSRPLLARRPVVERLWRRPVLAVDSCRVCLGLQLKLINGELAPASFP